MEMHELTIKRREATGKGVAKRLRRAGEVPAILYGGAKPEPVLVDPKAVLKMIHGREGTTQLLTLKFDGEAGGGRRMAIIRDLQFDPVTEHLLHVDLQEVSGDRTITVRVAVRPVGEPGAGGARGAQAKGGGGPGTKRRKEAKEAREGGKREVGEPAPGAPRGGGAGDPGGGVPGPPPQRGPAGPRSPRPDAQAPLAPRGPGPHGPRPVAGRDGPPREAPRVHERVRSRRRPSAPAPRRRTGRPRPGLRRHRPPPRRGPHAHEGEPRRSQRRALGHRGARHLGDPARQGGYRASRPEGGRRRPRAHRVRAGRAPRDRRRRRRGGGARARPPRIARPGARR